MDLQNLFIINATIKQTISYEMSIQPLPFSDELSIKSSGFTITMSISIFFKS